MPINKRHFEYLAVKKSNVNFYLEDLITLINRDLLNHFNTISDKIDDYETLKISFNIDISEIGDDD